MQWKKTYAERLKTPEQAIKTIGKGESVVTAMGAGTPAYLLNLMADNKDWFTDVTIFNLLALGDVRYASREMWGHINYVTPFASGATRGPVSSGESDFIPCHFSEAPLLFRRGYPVDTAIIQVSPPDKHGYCSMGAGAEYTVEAVKHAGKVIAMVNKHIPRVLGDVFYHVSQFDSIVEHDETLVEMPPAKVGDLEREIGRHCATLIKDGDTLQIGIGAVPEAVQIFLKDKKDLGAHTELMGDGMAQLMMEGNINNSKKSIHTGKTIVTFFGGTRLLYDFVDDNPSVNLMPVDYVNDPYVIAQNDNMVSINSCLQVDFVGQVSSEAIGLKQFSGVGGQVDFIRGAGMSRGGRAIIAVPSTAAKGTLSRIVSVHPEGTVVTTGRTDVDYVVTEYGIAPMRGKTLRERARGLIAIAHPDFRAELEKQYQKRFAR